MKVFVLGEGMVEQRADGVLAYGGDALNTAVYMARAGLAPQFDPGTDPRPGLQS